MEDIDRALANEPFVLKPSLIAGMGAFANRDFAADELIAAMTVGLVFTTCGRYVNHSPFPNTRSVAVIGGTAFQATTRIAAGEELTVDYRNVRELLKKLT